eukprot:XP_797080.1 PREDICTED: N-lysine methyltransferase SETD8 isoform X1 [Strongylocentrotus purpuratus]
MGKRGGRKHPGKSKRNIDPASTSSPQHGSQKITKYLDSVPSPPAANSGASTTMIVHEKATSSSTKNDLLSGIVTPESTPPKTPNRVPGREEDSPSPDATLVYPLDPDSPAGATEGAIEGAAGGGDASTQGGAGDSVRVKVKKEGDVQSAGNASAVIDTPTRHSMRLGRGRRMVKTPKSAGDSRSLNGQLEVEASPKNTGRGRGRKKGNSSVNANNSGRSASKPKIKKEPSMKTITDFFPVRRSDRRCKSVVDAERKWELEEAILSNREEGVKVEEIIGKGRGVVSTKPFRRGDFVVEYIGDLIDIQLSKEREQKYRADPKIGCYMYYFEHRNKSYCVDATQESGRVGRLLNHSRQGNCCTKLVDIGGRPHLILVAKRDIAVNEELLYDYGDRNKDTIQSHPWLVL